MNVNCLETVTGIYLGDRGISFKRLISNLLKKANLKEKYVELLTDEDSMKVYAAAFTSEQVDENNNYQVYEQLGDLTGNKFIVWYIYKRFPQLRCAEGVKVAARLRINLGSKNSFCSIAENYGFWDYISATNELRQRKKKSLLEDVFEAFLGATETIIDDNTKVGNGYGCVFKILSAIFDEIPISLNYEDLYDAKTRLKELFDIFGEKLGPLKYEEKREELIVNCMIYRLEGLSETNSNYRKVLIGQGSAALKADAEQMASSNALKNLALQGFVKYPPAIYAKFSGNFSQKKTTEQDILKTIQTQDKINDLFPTRGKSKYQTKYMSTVLTQYCRKRDFGGIKNCIKLNADPNIKDSEGMSSVDVLIIGDIDKRFVYKSLKRMINTGTKLDIHRNVFENYYSLYRDRLFIDMSKHFNVIEF